MTTQPKTSSEALLTGVTPRQIGSHKEVQDWALRHVDAVSTHMKLKPAPLRGSVSEDAPYAKREHERALVLMLQGWLAYADAHRRAYGYEENCAWCAHTGRKNGANQDLPQTDEPCDKCDGKGKVELGNIADDYVLGPQWQAIGEAVESAAQWRAWPSRRRHLTACC